MGYNKKSGTTTRRVDLLKEESHSRGNGDRARTLQGYGSRKVRGAHAKQDVLIDQEHKKRLNIK